MNLDFWERVAMGIALVMTALVYGAIFLLLILVMVMVWRML